MKLIGEGMSRKVYDLENGTVLKVMHEKPQNPKDITTYKPTANKDEWKWWNKYKGTDMEKYLCPCIELRENGDLVMKKGNKFKYEDYKHYELPGFLDEYQRRFGGLREVDGRLVSIDYHLGFNSTEKQRFYRLMPPGRTYEYRRKQPERDINTVVKRRWVYVNQIKGEVSVSKEMREIIGEWGRKVLPILLRDDGNGYTLMDGGKRLEAHTYYNFSAVEAFVFDKQIQGLKVKLGGREMFLDKDGQKELGLAEHNEHLKAPDIHPKKPDGKRHTGIKDFDMHLAENIHIHLPGRVRLDLNIQELEDLERLLWQK